jgi:glycosyltransferase involved in cell wall biosynthesis
MLTNQVDVGGIEHNVVRLTSAFVERGHEVSVMSRGGVLVSSIEQSGGLHVHVRRNGWFPFLREVRSIRAAIRELKPEVIHVFSASMNLRMQLALLLIGARPATVSSIMGLQISPSESKLKIRLRAWLTSIGVDRLLVMAPAIGEVVAGLPIRADKIEQMSAVGIELPSEDVIEARRWARAELGIQDGNSLVMTVGRLDASKSHDLFIEAAIHMCNERSDVSCVVVGGGALLNHLQDLIPTHLQDRILLHGERLDAPRLIAAADVYSRPGVVEGFVGITVLEAQAWGIPVVAFDTQDVRLAIENGVTGVLVPNGQPVALAEGVLHLLDHPEEAKSLGMAGREAVRENFSTGVISGTLERLYRSLLRQHS